MQSIYMKKFITILRNWKLTLGLLEYAISGALRWRSLGIQSYSTLQPHDMLLVHYNNDRTLKCISEKSISYKKWSLFNQEWSRTQVRTIELVQRVTYHSPRVINTQHVNTCTRRHQSSYYISYSAASPSCLHNITLSSVFYSSIEHSRLDHGKETLYIHTFL